MPDAGINAGVVLVTKFVVPGDKTFVGYIDYIDRDSATRNANTSKYTISDLQNEAQKYNQYTEYMDNPEKTTDLFTADDDELVPEKKQQLKKVFETAQENQSLMWQTVISFDNRWLADNGLYDYETRTLDEKKLKECTRGCMRKILEKEWLADTGIWSAAIHYNTDNVHIHIATVEPIPTREKIQTGKYAGQVRGKFKQSSIESGKGFVVNNILMQQEDNKKINTIIRRDIIEGKKNSPLYKDRELCSAFLEIRSRLPADKRLWLYNNNAMKHLRPAIDELSKAYIEKYHKDEFSDLQKRLSSQAEKYATAYGTSKQSRNYAETKTQDLYARLGNTILKELKTYDRMKHREAAEQFASRRRIAMVVTRGLNLLSRSPGTHSLEHAMRALKKNAKSEFEHFKNQQIYEMLQQSVDTEK
jgi:hypothetical protein